MNKKKSKTENKEKYKVDAKIHYELLELMKDTVEVFNKIDPNPEYFIAYGTLLGAIRDKGIIPWDDDIDLMITAKFQQQLEQDFNSENSILKKHKLWCLYDDSILRIRRDNCCKWCTPPWIDLFVCNKINGKEWIFSGRKEIVNNSDMFPLKKGTFENIQVNFPNNPEALLESWYGETWNVPIPSKPHLYKPHKETPHFLVSGNCMARTNKSLKQFPSLPNERGYPKKSEIPITNIIWKTAPDLTPKLKEYFKQLIHENPEYELRFLDDKGSTDFIKKNFEPEFYHAYVKLKPGAYKADFLRYALLYIHGGVYSDVKQRFHFKLEDIIDRQEDELLLSLDFGNGIQIAFMAAIPRLPIFYSAMEGIVKNVEDKYYGDGYLQVTGPGYFREVLDKFPNQRYKFVFKQGYRNLFVPMNYKTKEKDVRIDFKDQSQLKSSTPFIEKDSSLIDSIVSGSYAKMWWESDIYMKDIGLIIRSYNRPEYLQQLLDSLLKSDYLLTCERVLYDDGSSDTKMRDVFQQFRKNGFKVVRKPNMGNKKSMRTALGSLSKGCDLICYLDDDCIVKEDFIETLAKTYDAILETTPSEDIILTGFNCVPPNCSHGIIKTHTISDISFHEKESIGGINLFFARTLREFISNSWEEEKDWVDEFHKRGGHLYSTDHSVIEHIRKYGISRNNCLVLFSTLDNETSTRRRENLARKLKGFSLRPQPGVTEGTIKWRMYKHLRNLMTAFRDSKYPYAIICDDDMDPAPGFLDRLNNAVGDLPDDWRCLHLCPGFVWGRSNRYGANDGRPRPEHIFEQSRSLLNFSRNGRVFHNIKAGSKFWLGGPIAFLTRKEVIESLISDYDDEYQRSPDSANDVLLHSISGRSDYVCFDPVLCIENEQGRSLFE